MEKLLAPCIRAFMKLESVISSYNFSLVLAFITCSCSNQPLAFSPFAFGKLLNFLILGFYVTYCKPNRYFPIPIKKNALLALEK